MFKWLVDLDVRKTTAVLVVINFIAMGISKGDVHLQNAVPDAWIVHIVAWAGIVEVVCNAIMLAHNGAALLSPRDVPPAVKAIILAVLAGALMWATPVFAQDKLVAQLHPPHVTGNPIKDIGDDIKDIKPTSGAPVATSPAGAPALLGGGDNNKLVALAQKIIASTGADLAYATAMAKNAAQNAPTGITTAPAMRLNCLNAITAINAQLTGMNLKDANGNQMARPDPALFTNAETLAEVIDALQPSGPLWTSCAGAAQLAATDTLSLINSVVTGAAGIALVAPK